MSKRKGAAPPAVPVDQPPKADSNSPSADAGAPTIGPAAVSAKAPVASGRILKAIENAQTIGELQAATARLTQGELAGAHGPIYQARRRIVASGIE